MTKVHIFFAWQSDSPPRTNRTAIRAALREAKDTLERERPNIEIILDEATRDVPGSPDIPSTITKKIAEADIIVADITTINRPDRSNRERPCPNPNVLYELGYAVARRGWHRIITLFNEAHGDFPSDLPFDIAQRRVTRYRMVEADSGHGLAGMSEWVAAILDSPLDQLDGSDLDASLAVKRQRDVQSLRRLLQTLHIPTVEDFLTQLPRRIDDIIFWYWESFVGCVQGGLFHLYDPLIRDAVDQLLASWDRTLAHYDQYQAMPDGRTYLFWNPGDLPLPHERKVIWDEIDAARHDAASALASLLGRIHAEYLEVDVTDTSRQAWEEYSEFMSDLQQRLE